MGPQYHPGVDGLYPKPAWWRFMKSGGGGGGRRGGGDRGDRGDRW
jgi:hypothetical protein